MRFQEIGFTPQRRLELGNGFRQPAGNAWPTRRPNRSGPLHDPAEGGATDWYSAIASGSPPGLVVRAFAKAI